MKASVIIQARLGSSRLPGKVLLKLEDKTVLEHVILRSKNAKTIDRVIVATTDKKEDDAVMAVAQACGVDVYRGSEQDVLDRYFCAAEKFALRDLVRITADCPVMDPNLIDQVVTKYFESKADYCSNTLVSSFPDGEDIEVFSFAALKKAWQEAKLPSEREHVTPYIKKNTNLFKTVSFARKPSLADKRWTLDEKDDYQFLQVLYKHLYSRDSFFGVEKILQFLKENPEVGKINNQVVRNAGYMKSLEEDKKFNKAKR